MFNFDNTDMQRSAVSALGAVILSTACVFGAVGPAKAAEPTMAAWQNTVESRVDTRLMAATGAARFHDEVATVSVGLDEAGKVTGVSLARSSGSKALDDAALKAAGSVAYPALPGTLAGKPVKVAVQLFFGNKDRGMVASRQAAIVNQRYASNAARVQFAAR